MEKPYQLKIEDYTYHLDDDSIAKYPLNERDRSRLLIYREGKISEAVFNQMADFLPSDSLLVSNNTKVIRARIEFRKESGTRIEVFCLEPALPADYNQAFACTKSGQWHCIVGNLKKWRDEVLKKKLTVGNQQTTLKAKLLQKHETSNLVEFSWDNDQLIFGEILEHAGSIPIPPYLNRKANDIDIIRYQTIYSKHKGSVAAPTAGLHFTPQVFASLEKKNIKRHEVTLHVGAGTFKPVKSENLGNHEMHTEQFWLTPDTIPVLLRYLGNITAVGTTTMRTLESLYWLGVKLLEGKLTHETPLKVLQWEAYELNDRYSVGEALGALQQYILDSNKPYLTASTSILIAPPYQVKMVDRLITNFHQPQSTLLLLVAAFIGESWKQVYDYAIQNNFRFLSYGDSCLFEKA